MESEIDIENDFTCSEEFLTAEALVALRKSFSVEDAGQQVCGQKFYRKTDSQLETLESSLSHLRGTLEKKRAARMCDLMHAKWDNQLNVSLTDKLKGKYVQHMGHNVDGKVHLSPEESLFLLENGCIEILNGETPMSTEDGFAIMLKGKLGVEKYKVYSHLAQLGFVVVSHQNKLGVTRYEKNMNLDKHQLKKRKATKNESSSEPSTKRLTFSGVLTEDLNQNVSNKQNHLIDNNFTESSDIEIESHPDSLSSDVIQVNNATTKPNESVSNLTQSETFLDSLSSDAIQVSTSMELNESAAKNSMNGPDSSCDVIEVSVNRMLNESSNLSNSEPPNSQCVDVLVEEDIGETDVDDRHDSYGNQTSEPLGHRVGNASELKENELTILEESKSQGVDVLVEEYIGETDIDDRHDSYGNQTSEPLGDGIVSVGKASELKENELTLLGENKVTESTRASFNELPSTSESHSVSDILLDNKLESSANSELASISNLGPMRHSTSNKLPATDLPSTSEEINEPLPKKLPPISVFSNKEASIKLPSANEFEGNELPSTSVPSVKEVATSNVPQLENDSASCKLPSSSGMSPTQKAFTNSVAPTSSELPSANDLASMEIPYTRALPTSEKFSSANDLSVELPSTSALPSIEEEISNSDLPSSSTAALRLKEHPDVFVEESNSLSSSGTSDVEVMDVDSQSSDAQYNGAFKDATAMKKGEVHSTTSKNVFCDKEKADVNSNLDVMSCSSSNSSEYEVLEEESSDSLSRNGYEEDEEVTVIEVAKKETKPLAVIEILSDEEEPNPTPDSDEEISIIEVCPAPSRSKDKGERVNHNKGCKKEERSSPKPEPRTNPSMQFPTLHKKDVVCVPRPYLNLLPIKVQPAKESYVLELTRQNVPNQRASVPWNSYRDLQNYQQELRQRRMHGDFSSGRAGHPYGRRQEPYQNRSDSREDFFRRRYDMTLRDSRHDSSSDMSFNSDRVHSERPPIRSDGLLNLPPSQSVGVLNVPGASNDFGGLPNGFANIDVPPMGYHPLQNTSTINSVVSIRQQNMSIVQGPQPMLPRVPRLPFPQDMPMGMFPAQIMEQVQRTAMNMARDMIQNMMAQNGLPSFTNPNGASFPLQAAQEYGNGPSFPPVPDRQMEFDRRTEYRRPKKRHHGDPFPCAFKGSSNKKTWAEVRASLGMTDNNAAPSNVFREQDNVFRSEDVAGGSHAMSDGSDVEEVALTAEDVLWDSSGVVPLVKPGLRHEKSLVFKSLQVTQMARVKRSNINDRCFLEHSSLEVSFDVYLPGFIYRKTSPDIPKHRIIVVKSTDPIPRYSDLAFIQRKWNDGALLQVAFVDNGDVNFVSFNSIALPQMMPHET